MERYYLSHPFTGNEDENKADADQIRAAAMDAYSIWLASVCSA